MRYLGNLIIWIFEFAEPWPDESYDWPVPVTWCPRHLTITAPSRSPSSGNRSRMRGNATEKWNWFSLVDIEKSAWFSKTVLEKWNSRDPDTRSKHFPVESSGETWKNSCGIQKNSSSLPKEKCTDEKRRKSWNVSARIAEVSNNQNCKYS